MPTEVVVSGRRERIETAGTCWSVGVFFFNFCSYAMVDPLLALPFLWLFRLGVMKWVFCVP